VAEMTGRNARAVRQGNHIVYALRAKADSTDIESLNMKVHHCHPQLLGSEHLT
jgi:hypothetical protein